MNITATGGAVTDAPQDSAHGHSQGPLYKLVVGAIGIVYGDIGTSPIYAFRETFAGHHILVPDRLHIYGVLSLIFWTMMIVVTLKYVTIIMRADNKGEGAAWRCSRSSTGRSAAKRSGRAASSCSASSRPRCFMAIR
jgi:KUP system potassium uptake protein